MRFERGHLAVLCLLGDGKEHGYEQFAGLEILREADELSDNNYVLKRNYSYSIQGRGSRRLSELVSLANEKERYERDEDDLIAPL